MKKASILSRVVSIAKRDGFIELTRKVLRRVFPQQLKEFQLHSHRFADRIGLEIGGPSQIFSKRGLAPVYPIAGRIDNSNYSAVTVWGGSEATNDRFIYSPERAPGKQYINEATELTTVASEPYDFVLSSHVLEHVANPIKALKEWMHVLRPGGTLLLVVPHKDGTFDHRRPTTTLAHLIDDFSKDTGENDATHLPEILALHDLSLDPMAGTLEEFTARTQENAKNRCLHHHAFDTSLVVEVVNLAGLQIRFVRPVLPMHIVMLAEKLRSPAIADNHLFLANTPPYAIISPFGSDRPTAKSALVTRLSK